MALTKVTGSVIKDNVSLSGNVSVGGTLTYQDVTNVDALGIGTFRTGIKVLAGQVDVGSNIKLGNAGVITATSFVGSGANLTGIAADKIFEGNTEAEVVDTGSDGHFKVTTEGSERLRITSGGDVVIGHTAANGKLQVNNGTNSAVGDSTNPAFQIGGTTTYRLGIFTSNEQVIIANKNGDDGIAFHTKTASGGSFGEACRITSGGNILIGSSNESNNIRLANKLGIVGTAAYTGMSITNYPGTNASHAPMFDFNRSRGNADQNMTSVAASDKLGELIFRGSDGSSFQDAVTLRAYADSVSGSTVNGRFEIGTTDGSSHSAKLIISKEGHITPNANNTQDLGSTAKGWRNVYMNDLNLSNMKGNTNDIDGTQGSWTIQEGKDDLYIINRLNGKKFKIKMEEIS